jgi:hypothetical protein
MLSIKKINHRRKSKSLKRIRKRKSLKRIHKKKSLKNKKIIGGQMLFDDGTLTQRMDMDVWRRLGTPEDYPYNCVAFVFKLLKYGDDYVCNELAQIKSKYGEIGVSEDEIIKLLKPRSTMFIDIIKSVELAEIDSVEKIMLERLRFLTPGSATLATILVEKGPITRCHCFAIMRRQEVPGMQKSDIFQAIDPQMDFRLEHVCSLGEYLLKHTYMLTAEFYNIKILISNKHEKVYNPVTLERFHTVFPLPKKHGAEASAPLNVDGWNKRREKFGLPPLHQYPNYYGEEAALSEAAVSEAAVSEAEVSEAEVSEEYTDSALVFMYPKSPLPLEIPVIPELQKPS